MQHPWFEKVLKRGAKGNDLTAALNNIKKAAAHTKMKEAMFGFFVKNILTQQELSEAANTFKEFDKDGSGALSPEELKHCLREIQGLEYNEREVNELIERIDVDGDGEINYSEFLMASLNRAAMLSSERLEVAFRMFDLDGNGELTIKELKNML